MNMYVLCEKNYGVRDIQDNIGHRHTNYLLVLQAISCLHYIARESVRHSI